MWSERPLSGYHREHRPDEHEEFSSPRVAEVRGRDGSSSIHPLGFESRSRSGVVLVHPNRSPTYLDNVKKRFRGGIIPVEDGSGRDSKRSPVNDLHDLFGRFERHLTDPDAKTLEELSRGIPSVMFSFAQELRVDEALASGVAVFARKYRLQIGELILRQLQDLPGHGIQAKTAPVGISSEDNTLWHREGTSKLSVSRPTRPVGQWTLSRLLHARSLYFPPTGFPDSVQAFRNVVMERLLRQGRLRKLQPGMVAPAIFDLPRACAEMLKEDLTGNLSGSSLPVRALGERIVLTSSDLNQIQATTIRQYLNQTWPSDGTPILRVLQSGLPGPESPRGRQTGGSGVQDDIETHVRFSNAGLLVQLDGLAHLVIERAEQVAWLSGATQPSADPITRSSGHLHPELVEAPNLMMLAQGFSLSSRWKLAHVEQALDVTNPTVRLLQRLQASASETRLRSVPPIIWGFPTARRPDNEPGLELPWELLAELVAPEGMGVDLGGVLLRGREGWLRLVKDTDGVLVWHMDPSASFCSCWCTSGIRRMSGGDDTLPLDIDALRQFRHILAPCQGRAISSEQTAPAAMTKAAGPGYWTTQEVPGSPVRPRPNESDCDSDTVEDAASRESSIETESLSISENSEPEDELINAPDPANPIFAFVDPVARRLLGAYWKETVLSRSKQTTIRTKSPGTHSETPHEPHVSASCGSSLHRGPQHSSRSLSRPEKRRKEPNRDADSEEEDARKRQPPKKRRPSSPAEGKRTFPLACPFWKLDPREHRSCFRFNLDGIARVKQHLTRKHAPQFYCEFCMAVLDDSESHQRHIAARACTFRSCIFRGITHQQQRELSKRSRPNLSETERWFAIWDIVFPGRPRPPSPYIDTTLSEDLCQFREFAHARGPAIIAAEIQANSGEGSCMISEWERDPAALQSSVFARCFALIFDEWLAEHADDSSPPGPAQQPETSAAQSDSSSTEAAMEASTQPDANTQNTPASSASPGQDCPVTADKGKGKDRADEASQQQEESGETDDSWMQGDGLGQDEGYLDSTWQPDFLFDNGFDDFQLGAAPTNREENLDDIEMDIFLGAEEQSRVQHQGRRSRNTAWNSAYI